MLFRSNLFALVGGGAFPRFPPNKLILWDENKQKPVADLTFKTDIKAVRLKPLRMLILLESKAFLYSFPEL